MLSVLKIYLVDDHQMLIDGLKALLYGEENYFVIGENTNPEKAIDEIKEYQPDIVLTDISMPVIDGIELTKKVKKILPKTKIIALSMFGEIDTIKEMMAANADGYILKNTGKKELIDALNQVSQGKTFYSEDVYLQLQNASGTEDVKASILSAREIEIVELIAKEYTNAKIAETLFISERTVETHRKNIFRKTDTKSVIGLLKYCADKKLIKPIK